MTSHIHRLAVGYLYWATKRHGRQGWRCVGLEMRCVMDDFGNLVPGMQAQSKQGDQ